MKTILPFISFIALELCTLSLSLAQWVQTNGPYAGFVHSLAFSDSTLFAGTIGSGIFRSTDNGTTWTAANAGFDINGFCLGILPSSTGGTIIFVGVHGGVFRSTDDGTTWTRSDFPGKVIDLAISGDNIFAGTAEDGVFRSTDAGASWTTVNSGLTNLYVRCLAVSGMNLLAGSYGGGVFLSSNNGTTWTAMNAGLTNKAVLSLAISGTTYFAGTQDGGIFLSTNNGTSWAQSTLSKQTVHSLAASDSTLFAGTDQEGLYLSTNDGVSWSQTGLIDVSVYSVAHSGLNLFAGTGESGLFLSTDNGTSWTQIGVKHAIVYSLVASNASLFASTNGGLFRSSNAGINWTLAGAAGTNFLSLFESGSNLYAGAWLGRVFHSSNNGASWSPIPLTIKSTNFLGPFVRALAFDGMYLFAGTEGDGVFRSINNGTNWTRAGLDFQFTNCFALSDSNLFAGAYYGLYRTSDKGTSWDVANGGMVIPGIAPPTVYAITASDTELFAGTSRGVYLSTNRGNTWTPTSLANTSVNSVSVSTGVTGITRIFAGTDVGVFLSTNNGLDWIEINSSLTSTRVQTLAITGMHLFAGTLDGGVWRRSLSEITAVETISTNLPTHLNLYQNYPNPFNSTTTISFSLTSKLLVSVKLYDALGRQVATLVTEELAPGTYSKQWNASDLPSGVYFYRLQAASLVQTKKLLLLR